MIFVNQFIMSIFCFENRNVSCGRSAWIFFTSFLSHDFFFIKQGSLGKKAQKENHRILEDKQERAVN